MISFLFTIVLYAAVYGTAILIFRAAHRTSKNRRKKWIVFAGVLFLSLIAAARSLDVGTDTAETVRKYFSAYIEDPASAKGNILYQKLALVLNRFHLGERAFLFTAEFLILAPVAVGAYLRRDDVPIHLSMYIFLLMFYQVSFNWIRQSISCSFVFLAMILAQERKHLLAIPAAAVGVLFHSSAAIGAALLVFAAVFSRIRQKEAKLVIGPLFAVVALTAMLFWEKLFSWGIDQGLLPASYSGYIRVFSGQSTVDRWFLVGKRAYIDYLIRVALVVIPFAVGCVNAAPGNLRRVSFYKTATVTALGIYSFILFGMHSAYGNRISYTVEYVHVLNLGMCYIPRGTKMGRAVPLRNLLVVGSVLVYHIWLYYILGWHATVPFSFG